MFLQSQKFKIPLWRVSHNFYQSTAAVNVEVRTNKGLKVPISGIFAPINVLNGDFGVYSFQLEADKFYLKHGRIHSWFGLLLPVLIADKALLWRRVNLLNQKNVTRYKT